MEDSMDKLQQYGDELGEICEKHFPDIKRKIPKTKRRQMSGIDKLKNASQKEVRVLGAENSISILSIIALWL